MVQLTNAYQTFVGKKKWQILKLWGLLNMPVALDSKKTKCYLKFYEILSATDISHLLLHMKANFMNCTACEHTLYIF